VPTIGRASASRISLGRARIGVDVTTNGLAARVWVELTRRGDLVSRSASVVAAASASPSRVDIGLAGLRPGTRYSFRVVAENGAGTATGVTATFGTASRPRDERGRALRCTIAGTNGPDRLVGTRGRDVICGLGGGDVLVGRGGDDVLAGGPGADYLVPGNGRDRVLGGAGNDFVVARGGGVDLVFGGPGRDRARVDRRRDFTQSVVLQG
jgi:Ca2+-binding RTX toxin-like protein